MKLYIWTLNRHDCTCHYGTIAESIEKAREIVLYELTKTKKNFCNGCFGIVDKDYADMSFEEKTREAELRFHAPYYLRLFIRDSEPSVFDSKRLIEL